MIAVFADLRGLDQSVAPIDVYDRQLPR
jgi:hypothetical protein